MSIKDYYSLSSDQTFDKEITTFKRFNNINSNQICKLKKFGRPGEPANEAANVREVHIDTTQPDGQVIETEVLPGNEEIQNVVDLVGPPTVIHGVTNNDATVVAQEQITVRPTRKRKRGGTKFIPKRQKKKAANLSTEKRSSTQSSTADRAPRTRNNNTSASQQPVETHPLRSLTTAASQHASSQLAAALSSPLNHLRAPRQRLQTPDYEEREEKEEEERHPEEEEKEGNYHLRPRQCVRQRGKQAAADESLQKHLPQTNAPSSGTSTQPRQPQGQQPTSERRYDSFEEGFSEVQLNVPAASNRRGNRFQRIASKNALNRRQQALSITPPNPPQNQRVDDNPPHQRRGPKRQLIQQQEQQVNEERGNQQDITTEYVIQDEQLHDDFQRVIPQEYPLQIEQPSAAATPQLQKPPVKSSQVEQVALQGGRHQFDPTVCQCVSQNYLNQIARLHARELPRPFVNFVTIEANQNLQPSAPQYAPPSDPFVAQQRHFQQLVFTGNQQQQQYQVAMNQLQIGPPATPVHLQQHPVIHRMHQANATPQSQKPIQFVATKNPQHLLQSPFAAVNQQSQQPSEMNPGQAEKSAPPRQQTPAPEYPHMAPQFQLPPVSRHHFISLRNPQHFQYPSFDAEQQPTAIIPDQVESPASPVHPSKFNFKFLKLPSYLQTLFHRKIHFNNNNQILMQLQKFKNVFKMFFNLCRKMLLQILTHNFLLKFVILKNYMDFWNNLMERKMLEIVRLSMDSGNNENNNS
uniref:Uncharacterized protein n=1 Tax=Panagrolaimus sp. ES5 TaxID=591445 RepID=A0AC34GNE5_9BILA